MNFRFNPTKQNSLEFSLTEKDMEDAYKIKVMMLSEGWGVLKKYWEGAREEILDTGKNCVCSSTNKELSQNIFSILKGFDETVIMADRITQRAQDHLDRKIQEQEEQNGTGNGHEE